MSIDMQQLLQSPWWKTIAKELDSTLEQIESLLLREWITIWNMETLASLNEVKYSKADILALMRHYIIFISKLPENIIDDENKPEFDLKKYT